MSKEATLKEVKKNERSLEEACSELERELQVRRRCYEKWVSEGKLSRIDAIDRMERMEKAFQILNKQLDLLSAEQ